MPRALCPWVTLAAWAAGTLLAAEEKSFPGEVALRQFLRDEVRAIAGSSLADIGSRKVWETRRGELHRELREMLGLLPEPPRGDLRAVVTGVAERPDLGIVVEKLHFQSVPGLYVTANLYRPREVEGRLPTILYLCGHGRVKIGGVSYGNKAHRGGRSSRAAGTDRPVSRAEVGRAELWLRQAD